MAIWKKQSFKLMNMKTLYICDNSSIAGHQKMTLNTLHPISDIADYMCINYSFCTDCLPQNLSMAELDRCIKGSHHSCYSSYIKDRWKKLGAKDFNKVVVWHGMDSNSLLLLYFICFVMPDEIEIFHFNHCNWSYLSLTKYMPRLLHNPFFEKKLSVFNRNKFKRIYSSLKETEGIPKVAQGYQIKC